MKLLTKNYYFELKIKFKKQASRLMYTANKNVCLDHKHTLFGLF